MYSCASSLLSSSQKNTFISLNFYWTENNLKNEIIGLKIFQYIGVSTAFNLPFAQ